MVGVKMSTIKVREVLHLCSNVPKLNQNNTDLVHQDRTHVAPLGVAQRRGREGFACRSRMPKGSLCVRKA